MSGSGNKSSCLGMWFGLVILTLMIYSPIYFIFFDNVEDLVEDYSFQDVLFFHSVNSLDSEEEIERKSDFFEAFTKKYEMESGIDLSVPIYEAAQSNELIKSIKINYVPLTDSRALDYIVRIKSKGEAPFIYEMVIELKSGKSLKHEFVGIESSFFQVRNAICFPIPNFNFLFLVYKIPYADQIKF